jgi:hypothetical protein
LYQVTTARTLLNVVINYCLLGRAWNVTVTELLKKFHFFVEVEGAVLFSEELNAAVSCESVPQLRSLLL